MKQLLLVSADQTQLEQLTKALDGYPDVLRVQGVHSVKEAVRSLKILRVDLLITDLRLPEMDGFDLLSYVDQQRWNISCLVLNDGGPSWEKRARRLGVVEVLNKPVDPTALAEFVLEELESGVSGIIEGIGLAGLLQLLQTEQKTCILKVKAGGEVGQIFLVRGQLVNAQTKSVRGQDAAYTILGWDKPSVELVPGRQGSQGRSIEGSVTMLLMEAARRLDERTGSGNLQSRRLPRLRAGALERPFEEAEAASAAQPKPAAAQPPQPAAASEHAASLLHRAPLSAFSAAPAPAAHLAPAAPGVSVATGSSSLLPAVSETSGRTSPPTPDAASAATPIPPAPTVPLMDTKVLRAMDLPSVQVEHHLPREAPARKLERGMVTQATVKSGGLTGYLYLVKGELVDAQTDAARGEKALREMLAWPDRKVKVSCHFRRINKTLDASLTQLAREARLLEG